MMNAAHDCTETAIMSNTPRTVLWTDEDAPDRFVYGKFILERAGWTVDWANSVAEATSKLSANRYRALILDQMMPLEPGRGPEPAVTVWGGCAVLRWLRGASIPDLMPMEQRHACEALWQRRPLVPNRSIPAAIVSGYRDEKIVEAIHSASAQDQAIVFLPKPLDYGALQSFIEDDT